MVDHPITTLKRAQTSIMAAFQPLQKLFQRFTITEHGKVAKVSCECILTKAVNFFFANEEFGTARRPLPRGSAISSDRFSDGESEVVVVKRPAGRVSDTRG